MQAVQFCSTFGDAESVTGLLQSLEGKLAVTERRLNWCVTGEIEFTASDETPKILSELAEAFHFTADLAGLIIWDKLDNMEKIFGAVCNVLSFCGSNQFAIRQDGVILLVRQDKKIWISDSSEDVQTSIWLKVATSRFSHLEVVTIDQRAMHEKANSKRF